MKFYKVISEGLYDKHIFKAIFLLGGPGSGKTYIYDNLINTGKFKLLSPDNILEPDLKKNNIPLKWSEHSKEDSEKVLNLRNRSGDLTDKQQNLYLKGRLPIVLDKTGQDYESLMRNKTKFESLGYECLGIFVQTDPEIALDRNRKRARSLPDNIVTSLNSKIRKNVYADDGDDYQYEKEFKSFIIVDNDNPSKEYLKNKFAEVQKWINAPVNNQIALQWIENQKNMRNISKYN